MVESTFNLAAAIHQIRPYSYEGLALIRGLHHINYFFGVTLDPKKVKPTSNSQGDTSNLYF